MDNEEIPQWFLDALENLKPKRLTWLEFLMTVPSEVIDMEIELGASL